MLKRGLSVAEQALAETAPEAASRAFFAAAKREFGATYLQTRVYRRPLARLTSEAHWRAGGVVCRIASERWRPGGAAFDYVCFDHNPLLAAIRERRTSYRFSNFAPRGERAHAPYWEALAETRIGEALCTSAYGEDRSVASLHLGFEERSVDDERAGAVRLAGGLLVEHLLRLAAPPGDPAPRLTSRERDALGLVADGCADAEIAYRLKVSERTARFHIDNARRKVGALNRAHAAVRATSAGLL